jgi:hypothetical protein
MYYILNILLLFICHWYIQRYFQWKVASTMYDVTLLVMQMNVNREWL